MARIYPTWPSEYDPKYSRHCEYLMREKEERELASKKRPPLSWDNTKKPLAYRWGLYAKGKLVPNITAYDVEKKVYSYDPNVSGEFVVPMVTCIGPFLVKRLD